ncbi:hypothetical protein GCM10009588_04420 [Microbacterium phyllosphaerae]|nr:c-type cytochrome biogenesis protein CcsB [Microbacterium phyllosphaerae]
MSADTLSLLCVWTAIAIYVLAFLFYGFDLAKRSDETASDLRTRSIHARIGTSLTVLGFGCHLAGALLRGLASGRVPWSNLYEFAMTGTLLIVLVYLVCLIRIDLRFLGTFLTGLVVALLGLATAGFYVEVTPLAEPLKSVWLVIHVLVASLATAMFAIAASLSVVQLLQARREAAAHAAANGRLARALRTVPSSERLESLAYRCTTYGFVLWTFTMIAGAIWAHSAWTRYWGFDVKETWTFIIWVVYAGYIHARSTRGWRGARSSWLSIIGFTAVLFNFTVVNIFFKGLHAYSGIS